MNEREIPELTGVLMDAGLDGQALDRYLNCSMDSSRLSVLKCARKNLLESIHAKNEQLRILDYLIYNMKNKGENEK